MREIAPELEGTEVRVTLRCRQQVQHSVQRRHHRGGGLAGQRQGLCGAAGVRDRNSVKDSRYSQGSSMSLCGRCHGFVWLDEVTGFALFVCARGGYLSSENAAAGVACSGCAC